MEPDLADIEHAASGSGGDNRPFSCGVNLCRLSMTPVNGQIRHA
jgi:hypothetical protein